MPDGYSFAQKRRWWPDLVRPLMIDEQHELARLSQIAHDDRRRVHGRDAGIGYHLSQRRMVLPQAVDMDFAVQVTVTPFGRLVAHAHDAVNNCPQHPLDQPTRTLFKSDCPECRGTGAEKPDCWLCKGDLTIRVQKAYRNGYKKADLENVEDDGYCDCPACKGETCEICEGSGTVWADHLWREAQRVLLSALFDCREAFPRIEWLDGRGLIQTDALLSPASHAWLYDLGLSNGRFNDMFSDRVHLSWKGEVAAASFPTAPRPPTSTRSRRRRAVVANGLRSGTTRRSRPATRPGMSGTRR